MRSATSFAVGVVLIALAGCGASHQRATDYSVQQVKEAFKAHGLPLRQARFGPASGIVKLVGPGLEVDIAEAHQGTGTVRWTSFTTATERDASRRNVIVTWQPRETRSVKAALRQLN